MKEEVFKIHKYAVGHRINRQLLLSLEDVFKQYNKKYNRDMFEEFQVKLSSVICYTNYANIINSYIHSDLCIYG